MNKIIGLKQLRNNVASYAKEVQRGKSFIVVKQSKPLFKITPLTNADEGWEEVIDFTKFRKNGISAKELLARLKKL
ncbi:type II toxin-antitoxin system prevent-host-death family antitoxin [Candidatus Uhrbacteria bacterium]|nr:type II toxin-antitoxin system prevent-host-death family antitoxin [Candidatus Uhrbacteria bacterium]